VLAEAVRSGAADGCAQECFRFGDQAAELDVGQLTNAEPGVDAAVEECLVLPDVAGAGHDYLVHNRVANGEVCARGVAHAGERLVSVEGVAGEVGAEAGDGRVMGEGAFLLEFDDGAEKLTTTASSVSRTRRASRSGFSQGSPGL
jgi:hypothetical protein